MGETRVDLLHLLEDLADAYPGDLEETVLTELSLSDYRIDLSKPLQRGERFFKVVNAGPQQHDVQLVRLNRGESVQSALRWFASGTGESPGRLLGGLAGINRGSVGYFTANISPGEYALFCFVPDSAGKPHFMRGMYRSVRVR